MKSTYRKNKDSKQRKVKSLKELVKKITKKNRHKEMNWGGPVGREFW